MASWTITLISLILLVISAGVQAATYTVTSTGCFGAGSIDEAVTLANNNPGTDTITFTQGLEIQAGSCGGPSTVPKSEYFIAHVTESVVFEGNGARLLGSIKWVSSGGIINPLDSCPANNPTDIVLALTPGFIRVGEQGQNNSNIEVIVRDLELRELNSVARVESKGTLILEYLIANDILSKNVCRVGLKKLKNSLNDEQ